MDLLYIFLYIEVSLAIASIIIYYHSPQNKIHITPRYYYKPWLIMIICYEFKKENYDFIPLL